MSRRPDEPGAGGAVAPESRRGVLKRAAAALIGMAGASLAAQDAAKAARGERYYTFCGHTWTTASCPHPTGIPRIDARGYPLRARDGHPVDDLGRPVDPVGRPVRRDGTLVTDADGRPLPPAPRTHLCNAVAERFDLDARNQGAWYRCCGGRVRKLLDCCAHTATRINGDAAVKGYCYGNRKVFCVQYYDTNIRC